jgi:5-methylcytosine-specific restriction endonuclease McrA
MPIENSLANVFTVRLKTMQDTPGLHNCQNCGKELIHSATGGRRKRNCSKACASKYHSAKYLKPKQTHTCENCTKTFEAPGKRRYCSKPCYSIGNKNAQLAKKRAERLERVDANGFVTTECGWCKEPRTYKYQQGGHNAFHPHCTIEAQRARYRIKTVKRHSLINKPSRLSADEVVRVYGNTCAICNEPIDLTLKRTSSRGLTVDHWVPLSKGGSDDMSNLRPAHWNCNRKKSDKLPKEVNA